MPKSARQRSVRRSVKAATLFYGEGSDDEQWLRYLKGIYATSSSIRIDNGEGGSPDDVVMKMVQRREFNEYKKKYVLVDTDRDEYERAKNNARKNGITIIGSRRCLESELLKIMGTTGGILKRAMNDSSAAKSEFKKRCKYHDSKNYVKKFPKKTLDIERKKNKWLDSIITALEQS